MNCSEISILIPSINRPNQIINQLNFYHSLKTKIKINICDSTKKPPLKLRKHIKNLSKTLSINYFHQPGLNDRQAIYFLIENCKTKYSSFIGDDDLFIPEGMIKAANFLKENNDYRVAYGKAIIVDEKFLYDKNRRNSISPYWGNPIFSQRSSLERLKAFSKNYFVPMFAVHRTSEFLEDYLPCKDIPSKEMGEFLINYITLGRGKAMFVPYPYLIRKVHPNRYLVTQNFVDSLIDENFAISIPIFKDNIEKILLKSNTSKKRSHLEAKKFLEILLIEKFNNSSLSLTKRIYLLRLLRNFSKAFYLRFKNNVFRSTTYVKNFYKYLKILSDLDPDNK